MIDELDLFVDETLDDSKPVKQDPEVSAEEAIAFLRASLGHSLPHVFSKSSENADYISDSSLVRWFESEVGLWKGLRGPTQAYPMEARTRGYENHERERGEGARHRLHCLWRTR